MSFNQSRSTDKSDTQYRKTGRSTSSNQQRGSSGSFGRGSGGGGPASSPLNTSSSSSHSSNRSFRKSYNNAHGGQTRIHSPPGNPAGFNNTSLQRPVQNGSHVQSQLQGASDASVATATAKTSEPSAAHSAQAGQKAPTSQSTTPLSSQHTPLSSAQAAPPTSNKGEAAKTMTLQFGSLNASVMNGMQIPARTSSAPPNLDEQKHDQAHNESYRTVPSFPIPAAPKHQPPPRKDPVAVEQPYTGDTLSTTKAKKDQQVPPAPPVNQMQKPSVHPMTGMSIPLPFHHSQGSLQFGGHNPQIQSQSMSTAPLQMPVPMPLHMGNAPQLQQQVFVPGLQAHHMPQGLMQGQNMNFTAQMGPLLGPQLGNMGISMPPQYAQQQGGKFGGSRKTTVKITHPETHEVLRLDKRADTIDGGSSGTRTHANVPNQSQPIASFAASHPISYYPPSSYGTSSLFFPPPNSLPLTSNQVTNSQPTRLNYQANHGHQNVSLVNPSPHNMLPANKTGPQVHVVVDQVDSEHARDLQNGISSTSCGPTSPIPKPSVKSVVDSSKSNSSDTVSKCESQMMKELGETGSMSSARDSETSSEHSKHGSDSMMTQSSPKESVAVSISKSTDNLASSSLLPSSMSEESLPVGSNNKNMGEPLSRSNSMKDHYQKQGRKGQLQQVGGQSLSVSGSPSNAGASVVQNIVSEKSASTPVISVSVLIPPGKPSGTGDIPADSAERGSFSNPSEVSGTETHQDKSEELLLEGDISKFDKLVKGKEDEQKVPADSNDISRSKVSSEHLSSNQIATKEAEEDVSQENEAVSNEVSSSEMVQKSHVEVVKDNREKAEENLGFDTSETLGSKDFVSDSKNSNSVGSNSVSAHPDVSNLQTTFSSTVPKETAKHGKEVDNIEDGLGSLPASSSKDKPIIEQNKAKAASKGKKKRKEILQKADALGTTTDLYNAYKGPEERKEAIELSDCSGSTIVASLSQVPTDIAQDTGATDRAGQMKAEPEDWEDAAEMSTPKLKVTEENEQVGAGSGTTAKKYSRDFLMKFAEQCYDLPQGFEIAADIADALMGASVTSAHLVERDSYPSPGRITDRLSVPSRLDHRGSGVFEDDRWSKVSGPFVTGRDMRMDTGFGSNAGFHSAQGGNFGIVRNPRSQNPVQYSGGILSGPMQGMGPPGGMRRNSPDAERWQRATNFQQKGLIPSPQTPLQIMHRAEKKYEVGKVSDEEEVKQRQLKAILNKLTPQNFEKLFEQVKAVNIDNVVTLTGVISQIFDKALTEPTFCEMYANFCSCLASELPDLSEDNEKITFKRLLLNKCQEEFERGEREQEEANKADDESETKLSEEQREEKRLKARRRMLGNIRLIGELYKKRMLTERIMHECIKKLLGQYQDPDEEDLEALCKLMSTIGEMIDHAKAKEHMDAYFERMKMLSNNMNLSSRVRFMLKDALDLRKNKWQQRRKIEGPKKIEEVHRDAAQERQAQATRLSRGPGINHSARKAPMDFGPRSPMISPPGAHLGGYRGLPDQPRGYPSQDVRFDDRQSFDGRTLSIPLTPRPTADDSITLGPQGGLARGMSIRGPPTVPGASVTDVPFVPGDSRRISTGLNGYSNVPERKPYGSRDELMPRSIPERLATAAVYSQSNAPERNLSFGSQDVRNPDRSVDRSLSIPPTRTQVSMVSPNIPLEKLWPEERMRDMSIQAIKEFYSARDEREVALCVEDLNAPSFHSSMVSLWITDSFERKDIERELLAKLLVNLAKSRDGILSQVQLIKGFESVLSTLEDAVNDAPRAPEFLGNLFAKIILENVISLEEIGRLLYQGGEEPGLLREAGLAGDVLGSTLEAIQSDKGDNVLNEIRTGSSLRLKDFRPPDPLVSKKLEKFI